LPSPSSASSDSWPPRLGPAAIPRPTTAHGFTPGAAVTVTIDPGPATLGNGTADGGGALTLDATIPDNAQAGDHTITAAGAATEGTLSLTARVTVTAEGCGAAGAPAPGGATPPAGESSGGGGNGLPITGSGLTMLLVQVGLALAAVGGVAMALSRRRRHSRVPV
jgi:hypothetical protein